MTAGSIWKQGAGYGLVGLLQMLVDWACFVALTSVGAAVVPANIGGRIVGALLGFALNGMFTFRGQAGGRLGWRRFARFLGSWLLMSVLSTLGVHAVDAHAGLQWAWALKPAIDVVLAAAGFVVSRYWIYR